MATRLLLFLSLLLAAGLTLAACGDDKNVEGSWNGTLTWNGDAGTHTVYWSIFQPPALPGIRDSRRVVLSVESGSDCVQVLDYGILVPADDGTFTLPVQTIPRSVCFPEVTAEALGSATLELVITAQFNESAGTGGGNATLQSRSGGAVATTFRTGTWTATRR